MKYLFTALALMFALSVQAAEGVGDGFTWEYNCESVDDISSVAFITSFTEQDSGTEWLLDSCAVLVTVDVNGFYRDWDKDAIADIIAIADKLDVPQLFLSVTPGHPFCVQPAFSPPIVCIEK